MVDVTGILQRQVQIVPDKDKLAVMGLSIGDVESALSSNNVEPGSMTVRDGYYEYNIKFSTLLRTAEDVEKIIGVMPLTVILEYQDKDKKKQGRHRRK